ncbi:hypothetical protein MLD38_040613 [Melastoma candidum]|nr:hypothetical protein MLD38_040613 [Melastoma candidum]
MAQPLPKCCWESHSFVGIIDEEHRFLRRLTAAPVTGHEALSLYIPLHGTKSEKPTLKSVQDGKEYTHLTHGLRAMAINIPGFAYQELLRDGHLRSVLDEKRKKRDEGKNYGKKDMMDGLMEVESCSCKQHPEFTRKERKEQEEISQRMPPTQEGLTLKEYRQMEYLSNVTDETLRLISISLMAFRSKTGRYIIPKGWKVLLWFRSVHLDPEIYPDPKRFNPSRWKRRTTLGFAGETLELNDKKDGVALGPSRRQRRWSSALSELQSPPTCRELRRKASSAT